MGPPLTTSSEHDRILPALLFFLQATHEPKNLLYQGEVKSHTQLKIYCEIMASKGKIISDEAFPIIQ